MVIPEYDMYLDGNLVNIDMEMENEDAGLISPRAYYGYWKVGDSLLASGSYTKGKTTQKYHYPCMKALEVLRIQH